MTTRTVQSLMKSACFLVGLLLAASPAAAAGASPTSLAITPRPTGSVPVVVAQPAAPLTPVASGTPGPDGRIAISQLPYAIFTSGSYYLTKNLTTERAGNGIEVHADDVTIDLNGFALKGGSGSGAGIRGFALGVARAYENLRVVNGTVRGWDAWGLDVSGIENVQLAGLRVTANGSGGVRTGKCAAITGVTVRDNDGVGIESGDCTTVHAVNVVGNQGHGIVVGKGSTVSSSSACENDGGIVVGAGSTVLSSTASGNRGDGIRAIAGSTIKDSTASDNGGYGINVGGGSNVRSSVANNNQKSGIASSDFGIIADSTAYANVQYGIEVGIGHMVTGNVVSANVAGIYVYHAANRIDANHSVFNQTGILIQPGVLGNLSVNGTFALNQEYQSGLINHGYLEPFCPPDQACLSSPAPAWHNFQPE